MMRHPLSSACFLIAAVALEAGTLGCNKAKELADSVKDSAEKGLERAKSAAQEQVDNLKQAAGQTKDQLGLSGSFELTIDAPVSTSACAATLVGGARGVSVLKLSSTPSGRDEAFPSVYVQAQAPSASLVELTGRDCDAIVFVQPTANGPIWYATSASPVTLKIMSTVDGKLTAEFQGKVRNSATGQELPLQGKLTAKIEH